MARRRASPAGPRHLSRLVFAALAVAFLLGAAQLAAVWTSSRAQAGPGAATAPAASAAPGSSPAPSASAGSPAAAATPIRSVVVLGDSVPAGTDCDCRPYVDLVAASLTQAEGTSVSTDNDAVPGQTSAGLLAALGQQDIRNDLRSADVVVVEIGANDFDESAVTDGSCSSAACYRGDVAALGARLDRILGTVRGLAGERTQIVVAGYWNVFLDGAVGRSQGQEYVANSDSLTRAANDEIAAVARADHDTYVDLYAPFKGDGSRDDTGLLAGDGDHPSAQGHQVIASAITATLRG